MTFEEIDRIAGIFISLGVNKIRLTGGEPLLRRNLHELVSMLSMRDAEIAMTTNGVLLPRYAPALSAAGLDRVTVSLDAIDESTFADYRLGILLQSDRRCRGSRISGFRPCKINTVVKRNSNENEILDIVERFS